ncbi:MAG: tetratricopeptide repeat protein [Streptosporangiaceae bacterium]
MDEAGYCRECLEPLADESAGPPSAASAQPTATDGPVATTQRTADKAWWGLDLVVLPDRPPANPVAQVQVDPRLPPSRRVCRACSPPTMVGQSHDGQEALLSGACHRCGKRYSFEPRLASGVTVAGRYQIIGCIGHGGLGWVFLAEDTNLREQVVLKGLIDPGDRERLTEQELEFLKAVDHKNVVRVRDFAAHLEDDGTADKYIVMEYVRGHTVADAVARGSGTPLEHVIAWCLQMLLGLDYLHRHLGWLHCDITPSNLMVAGDSVKIIDLGAGCRIGTKGHTWGTQGYRAPEVGGETTGNQGRTESTDLYSAGMTLKDMFDRSLEGRAARSEAGEHAVGPSSLAIESLEHLIRRAAAEDPAERFRTAAEMAGQLSGVLRDFVALRTGCPYAAPISLFSPEPALPDDTLDRTLGSDLPLTWWTAEDAFRAAVDGASRPVPGLLPPPAAAVELLPSTWPDREDPAADLVLSLSGRDPVAALEQAAGQDSAEADLLRCRAELSLGGVEEARNAWTRARDRCGDGDYRVQWHKALIELSAGNVEGALAGFSAVHRAVPGEVAPKVSLGLCAEYLANTAMAERWYQMAWQADRSYVSAAFGLARTQMRLGNRAAAVAAVDEVPDSSRYARCARVVAFRLLTGGAGTSAYPTEEELNEAEYRLGRPPLRDDKLRVTGDRLDAVLLEARLGRARSRAGRGSRAAIAGLRARLEARYRDLADHAQSKDQHTILIDLANHVRTRTLD